MEDMGKVKGRSKAGNRKADMLGTKAEILWTDSDKENPGDGKETRAALMIGLAFVVLGLSYLLLNPDFLGWEGIVAFLAVVAFIGAAIGVKALIDTYVTNHNFFKVAVCREGILNYKDMIRWERIKDVRKQTPYHLLIPSLDKRYIGYKISTRDGKTTVVWVLHPNNFEKKIKELSKGHLLK